jgi:hypothetical protein
MEFGEPRLGQESLCNIYLGNAAGGFHGFVLIAACEVRGEQVELDEIAKRSGIAWIEHEGSVNLLAETPRQKQLLEHVRMSSHDTQNLGVLAVILGGISIERHSFLGQSLGCDMVAKRVADLGKQVVHQGIVRGLEDVHLH